MSLEQDPAGDDLQARGSCREKLRRIAGHNQRSNQTGLGECRNQPRPNSLSALRERDTLLRPLDNPLLQKATEQGKEAGVLDMNSVSFRDLGLKLTRRAHPRLCASTQCRYN